MNLMYSSYTKGTTHIQTNMTNEQTQNEEGNYTASQVVEMYGIAYRLVRAAHDLEHLQACVDSIRNEYEPRIKQITRVALDGFLKLPKEIRDGVARVECLNITNLEAFLK